MHDDNSAPPCADRVEPAFPGSGMQAAGVPATALETGFDGPQWKRTTTGLTMWFVVLALFGVGGLLFGQEELALLAAVAGLFVAAQAADFDPQWRMLHLVLAWVVPFAGTAGFVALGFMFRTSPEPGVLGGALVGLCFGGALASALTLFRPFSHALATYLFRRPDSSHTTRLAARMVFLCLLFAIPGWFAVRRMFASLGDSLDSLVDPSSLGTGLVGYVLLAVASVGFMLQRDTKATLQRLGIGRIDLRQVAVIVIGVAALFLLNSAADAVQRRWFHALWIDDQRMSEAIGGSLGLGGTIVLGLSAGIGEEITMRGALQPWLGVVGTSLVFASLHVQYSWYGMVVIFLLGMLLGTIRNRSNTTVAMAVHALYDMAAVLSAGKP